MTVADQIKELLHTEENEARKILEKAYAGGEINNEIDEQTWYNLRFQPNVVFIDEAGYTEMCVDALKILGTTAATDYGSSRQRDLGQLWADMTRGYLGEYAVKIFLREKFGIEINLGHEIGDLEQYLPSDIESVNDANDNPYKPRINCSIKTSKWNGIWLDVPGDQFNKSDVHVFVKVGTGRDHLFAFFKHISVFKDKVLPKGKKVGAINDQEAEEIYNNLPSFSKIPAYICGFVRTDNTYKDLPYGGKKGRTNYNVTSWNGPINPGDIERIKIAETVQGSVKFEGIGSFSHDKGFLFNTGNLNWEPGAWRIIAEKLKA